MKIKPTNPHAGQVLVLVLIFLMVSVILALALFSRVGGFVVSTRTSIAREQATQMAEAGIDYAVWQLNESSANADTPDPLRVGVGEFDTDIEDLPADRKRITSTGCVPACNAAKKQTRIIKVEVTNEPAEISFSFAIHQYDPVKRLHMEDILEDSPGMVINGNVYAGQISQDHGIINGDVFIAANWEPGNEIIVNGTIHERQPPLPPPEVDFNYWKAQAEAGGITVCPHRDPCLFSGPGSVTIGPQRFIGSPLVFTNGINVTIAGPIYTDGGIHILDGAQVKLSESFGSLGTVVITESALRFRNGVKVSTTTADPKGFILFIADQRGNGDTIDFDGDPSEVNAVLYATVSGVELDLKPESTIVGSIIGREVLADPAGGTVTYDRDLERAKFAPAPEGGTHWQIRRGTYRFAD